MALKYVLLSQLAGDGQTGYDIVKSFDTAAGYFWQATHQQVYRELAKLFAEKLVSMKVVRQSEKPDKKLYRTTKAGLEALRIWMLQPLATPQVRDPLLVKIHAAAAVGTEGLETELERDEEKTRATLAVYRSIEKRSFTPRPSIDYPLHLRVLYIALRRGISGAQARLRWLKEAQTLLSS